MLAPPTIAPVFIGYRRDDTGHAAARLRDALAERGHEVWFDLENIGTAERYRLAINKALRECEVALILIGPQWTTVCGRDGSRRIDDLDDDVRIEVRLALERPDITLVPVLVDSARMPARDEMPDDLREICELSGAPLMRDTWPYCVKGLHETIQQAARRGWRAWGEALLVAAAVAVPASLIAANDGLATDSNREDGDNLARLSAQRAVLWALIMGAVLAWVAWRRPGHRWGPALRAGLLWGALFGVLGAVVHAIPTYFIDDGTWKGWNLDLGTVQDVAYAAGFGASGAGIGALVGAAWNPPGIGRGLLAGLAAGGLLAWLAHTALVDDDHPRKVLTAILLAVGILAATIATEWLTRAATTRRSSA